MKRLIKVYNQNRYIIWLSILIITSIIVLIQILNNFLNKKNNYTNIEIQNTIPNAKNNNYSVISGAKVDEEISSVIDEFMNYCNNGEIAKAYELLSSDCKNTLYPTLNDFVNGYYNKLLNKKNEYSYQAWITNGNKYTYKIDFTEDMLSTGKSSTTSISDYYTVIKEKGKYELNINKFIDTIDINKTKSKNNITIEVNKKNVYMNYEIYEIRIVNNTSSRIMIDSLEETNTIFLEDESGQKYYCSKTEVLEEDLSVGVAQGKTIELKFRKEYKPNKKVQTLKFSNIIINNKKLEFDIPL